MCQTGENFFARIQSVQKITIEKKTFQYKTYVLALAIGRIWGFCFQYFKIVNHFSSFLTVFQKLPKNLGKYYPQKIKFWINFRRSKLVVDAELATFVMLVFSPTSKLELLFLNVDRKILPFLSKKLMMEIIPFKVTKLPAQPVSRITWYKDKNWTKLLFNFQFMQVFFQGILPIKYAVTPPANSELS